MSKKSKYQPAYKCSMCNKVHLVGKEFEADQNDLPKLLESFLQNQRFAGNPYLHQAPMFIVCRCRTKDSGLAQFIGFKKID